MFAACMGAIPRVVLSPAKGYSEAWFVMALKRKLEVSKSDRVFFDFSFHSDSCIRLIHRCRRNACTAVYMYNTYTDHALPLHFVLYA